MSTVALSDRTRPFTREDILRRVRAALTIATVAAAFVGALAYCSVALRRLGHPFELEWLEGSSLQHVQRVLHGQPLYTRPTVQWTPNIYPPLYYWISALVSHVVGLGFPALRAVSVASSVVLGASVFLLVRDDTRELVGPTVATGLVYASYRIGGAWYDVARVDSLFVALLVLGLLLARRSRNPRDAVVAAGVMVCAVFTKQSAFVPAVAALPWLWVSGRRLAIAYAGAFAGGCAALFGYLQLGSHGWFSYYMLTVPAGHALDSAKIIGFFTGDLLGHVAPALAITVVTLAAMWREREQSPLVWFYVPVFGALLFAAYSARVHTGGWDNVLLPAYIGIALVAGFGVGRMRTSGSSATACAVLGLVVLQFVTISYAPWKQIPPASSVAAGNDLLAELRSLPQPVMLTGAPWMLDRAGDRTDATAQASALVDVLRARAGDPARHLQGELIELIRTHHYCSIVIDRPAELSYTPPNLERYYEFKGVLLPAGDLRPVTGMAIIPWEVWVPRGGAPCG